MNTKFTKKQPLQKTVFALGLGLTLISLSGCSAANSVAGTGGNPASTSAYATPAEKAALTTLVSQPGFIGSSGSGSSSSAQSSSLTTFSTGNKASIQAVSTTKTSIDYDGVSYPISDYKVIINGKQYYANSYESATDSSVYLTEVYTFDYLNTKNLPKEIANLQAYNCASYKTRFSSIMANDLYYSYNPTTNLTIPLQKNMEGTVTYKAVDATFTFSNGTLTKVLPNEKSSVYTLRYNWPFIITVNGVSFAGVLKGDFQSNAMNGAEITSELTTVDGSRKVGRLSVINTPSSPLKVSIYNAKGELENLVSTQ